jgi:3-phosphoshikimate 1-carboxyvinyltransferase
VRLTAVLPRTIRVGGLRQPPTTLAPHPDKAISQRATLLAALADGRSTVRGLADCRDVDSNLAALRDLDIAVERVASDVHIDGVDGRSLHAPCSQLDAGNSATTSRLLVAVLAGGKSDVVVTGNALLRARSMREVLEPLRLLGGRVSTLESEGCLPVRVRGTTLHGGAVDVEVDSAQPVSALLFAGSLADTAVVVRRRTAARDHTERLLRWTGLEVHETPAQLVVSPGRPRAFDLTVPGDPSAAGFLAALHVAAGATSELRLTAVGLNQRRTGLFTVLRRMGVEAVEEIGPDLGPEPVGDVVIRRSGPLRGVHVSGPELVQSAIDELPLLAALAATADTETTICDAAELRGKDTDRIAMTVALLRAFGVDADPLPDGFVVGPSVLRPPAHVVLPADHRIIFAALTLSLLAGPGTVLEGVDAVATSHPGALADFGRYASYEVCA